MPRSAARPLAQDDAIHPFRVAISQADLDDLKMRLARPRWPEELPGAGADYGARLDFVREMTEHWAKRFDWRAQEAWINAFPHFTTTIDNQPIHFVHVRSKEANALPLILTHGWPSTFAELLELVAPLTEPRAHGGQASDAFDVIIPSVPGFTFSSPTRERGWDSTRVAKAWDQLMGVLGYERYGAHGGDVGALVTHELAILAPKGLVGAHLLEVYAFPKGDPKELEGLSSFEQEGLKQLQAFQARAGYQAIQGTRPQTLAFGLTDSPVGQLAWNSELFTGFGGVFMDPTTRLDPDLFLTHVSLYWFTNTSNSSSRFYYENAKTGAGYREVANRTPTGVAVFPYNFRSIRKLAERTNNIVHWSQFDRGGHFAAMDAPDLLVQDLRAFFRSLR